MFWEPIARVICDNVAVVSPIAFIAASAVIDNSRCKFLHSVRRVHDSTPGSNRRAARRHQIRDYCDGPSAFVTNTLLGGDPEAKSKSMVYLEAFRLFRRHLKDISKSAQFRKRPGLHLPHQICAMHLHRKFGDADIVGNLFVQATRRDLSHDLTLAGAERFEALPEHTQGPVALPTCTIASEAGLDGVEKFLITERLCEKLYGTALHRLHGHRNVAVRGDEDDRNLLVRSSKVALKLKTALPRHSNVEHQTARAIRRFGTQKIRNRRKLLGVQTDRPQQTHNRVAKLGIVINDKDAGAGVMHPRNLRQRERLLPAE